MRQHVTALFAIAVLGFAGCGNDPPATDQLGTDSGPVSTELGLTDLKLSELMEMLDAPPLEAFDQSKVIP